MGCFLGPDLSRDRSFGSTSAALEPRILGLFTACPILTEACLILLLTAGMSGNGEMDRVVIPSDIPWLRGVTGAVQISPMFGIYTVTASGAGL